MNNNHTTDHLDADDLRAEIEDQLMDRCLDEVLGGMTPAISDRQQSSVSIAPASTEEPVPEKSSPRYVNWVATVVALGVCLCVGVILQRGVLLPDADDSDELITLSESEVGETPSSVDFSYDVRNQTWVENSNDPTVSKDDVMELHVVREQLLAEEQRNAQLSIDYEKLKKATGIPKNVESFADPSEISRSRQRVNRGQLWELPNPNFPGAPIFFQQRSAENPNNVASGPNQSKFSKELPAVPQLNKLPYNSRLFSNTRGRTVTDFYSRAPVLDPTKQQELSRESAPASPAQLGIDFVPVEERERRHWGFKTDGLEGVGPGNRGDNYAPIIENEFQAVTDAPLSTFSIDVDTASYSNVRRMLTQNNMLPPPDAVRIEELVNYFNYDYPAPVGDDPFSVSVDAAECPWQPEHRLVRIALKGKEIPLEEKPASNLVFLLDVSGSMNQPNKIELLKSCLKMMVDYLGENDSIAIVTYASGTRVVLPATSGDQKAVIMNALDNLRAGGSTNGAAGIQLAYEQATKNFIPGGINRVILATDGDFNVGVTSQGDLHRMIEEKAKSNVFLTTLGFGFGNLQDNTIELLADKGNGNYSYIDTLREGRKVLIDEMGSTLHTIAKDVKIQIEFNPLEVAAYRLIGYENRILAARDFNDDTKDAGEIGAGHTVTAFYELIPAGEEPAKKEVDVLEFQKPLKPSKAAKAGDMMVVKLRYKQPDQDHSQLLKMNVGHNVKQLAETSRDFRFASAVASFGMILRGSQFTGHANYDSVLEIAEESLGETPESYRSEFVELVKQAKALDQRK